MVDCHHQVLIAFYGFSLQNKLLAVTLHTMAHEGIPWIPCCVSQWSRLGRLFRNFGLVVQGVVPEITNGNDNNYKHYENDNHDNTEI